MILFSSFTSLRRHDTFVPLMLHFPAESSPIYSFAQKLSNVNPCNMLIMTAPKASKQKNVINFDITHKMKRGEFSNNVEDIANARKKEQGHRMLPWITLLDTDLGLDMKPLTWLLDDG